VLDVVEEPEVVELVVVVEEEVPVRHVLA